MTSIRRKWAARALGGVLLCACAGSGRSQTGTVSWNLNVGNQWCWMGVWNAATGNWVEDRQAYGPAEVTATLSDGQWHWVGVWGYHSGTWVFGAWAISLETHNVPAAQWISLGNNRWYLPVYDGDVTDFDFSVRVRIRSGAFVGVGWCVQAGVPRYKGWLFGASTFKDVLENYFGDGDSGSHGYSVGTWLTLRVKRYVDPPGALGHEYVGRWINGTGGIAGPLWDCYYIDGMDVLNGHGGYGILVEGAANCEYQLL